MKALTVVLASCSLIAGCSGMPTAPSPSTGATFGGPLAMADPSLSGTDYTLIAIDSDSMTYVTSSGVQFEAPYDSGTTFRRANLNHFPTDPTHPECPELAEDYNNVDPVNSDSFLSLLSSYASQQCRARIVAQLSNLSPGDSYQPGDPYLPPNPVRILSFQPIP